MEGQIMPGPVIKTKENVCNRDPIRIQIERSLRRTCQLTVKPDGTVLLRMPLLSSEKEAEELVRRHRRWILKRIETYRQEAAAQQNIPKLTDAERNELKKKAKQIFPERVEYYARQMGLDYAKLSYRFQKGRWGSCTRTGNLSFNCLLTLAPPGVLDSVVVHELCHRKYMNHSAAFYVLLEMYCPDYKSCRRWLKEHGDELIRRL